MGDRWTARRATLVLAVSVAALACSGVAGDTGGPSPAAASDGRTVAAADAGPSRAPSADAEDALRAPPTAPAAAAPDDRSRADRAGGDRARGDQAPSPAPRQVVAAAVDDLAARLTLPPERITVALAEAVTWPDDSLGCPLGNRQYVDGAVEGTRVHLIARGALYRYHTGGDRTAPFLCDTSLKSEVPIRRIEP